MGKNVTRKKGGKGGMIVVDYVSHRLNMELDLQDSKFILAPCAQQYSLSETP
jgi:hypothetical protein